MYLFNKLMLILFVTRHSVIIFFELSKAIPTCYVSGTSYCLHLCLTISNCSMLHALEHLMYSAPWCYIPEKVYLKLTGTVPET